MAGKSHLSQYPAFDPCTSPASEPPVDYHEFVCAGAPCLFVATADPDPAHIPGAAQGCCRRWVYVGSFRLGDGTHTPTVDAAVRARVASDGYHLYLKRPTP